MNSCQYGDGMAGRSSGFREKEHTADWELEIWAPDLPGLLLEAARGMYWLMGARLEPGDRLMRTIEFSGDDAESCLVSFLHELIYLCESEEAGFDSVAITMVGNHGRAELGGARLAIRGKEIKAVTYHNLAVRQTSNGLEATLVFDV
jgi:SHS2 domain-containing protein